MIKEAIVFFLFAVFFINLANASIMDFITGRATEQGTNISITINGAPLLGSINSPILACEASSLSYLFNASDSLGETLTFSLSSSDPFFVRTYSSSSNATHVNYIGELYSVTLGKAHIANYSRTVSVTDGTALSDSKNVNFSVIEINNAPSITNISDKTVSVQSGTGNLYIKVNVSDTEDGNQDSGNFSFNLTFLSGSQIFNITQAGVINVTFNSTHAGNYVLRVCASDLGIPASRIHSNISFCGQDGSNQSSCDNFNLEITQGSVGQSGSGSGGGSGGSGGGAGISCEIKWGCRDWDVCRNAQNSLNEGILTGEDYRLISLNCLERGMTDETCGFQKRDCIDVNECKKEIGRPAEIQECYYTENPSCNDGVKNCHDGSCEFLVDCGGPCGGCPTCTDGIRNQGEEAIDCGGPCPQSCVAFTSPDFGILERMGFEGLDKKLLGTITLVLSVFSVLFIILAIKLARVLKLSKN